MTSSKPTEPSSDDRAASPDLFLAIRKGHVWILKECIENNPLLLTQISPKYKHTPLMHAALYSQLPALQALIPCGHLDQKDELGWTALMYAAFSGFTDGVEALLNTQQVDVNAQNKQGVNALLFAAGHGHAACTDLLLKHTALLDAAGHPTFALDFLVPKGHPMTPEARLCRDRVLVQQEQRLLASTTASASTSRPRRSGERPPI